MYVSCLGWYIFYIICLSFVLFIFSLFPSKFDVFVKKGTSPMPFIFTGLRCKGLL